MGWMAAPWLVHKYIILQIRCVSMNLIWGSTFNMTQAPSEILVAWHRLLSLYLVFLKVSQIFSANLSCEI